MVSLISTSDVIKTFIVLTIIDCVSSETEKQRCTRYIETMYLVSDPYEMFKKGFLWFTNALILDYNKTRLPDTHNEPLKMILRSMNKYTKGYFNEVLNRVTIEGKDTLQNPKEFCEEKYNLWLQKNGQENANNGLAICTNIIQQKLNINPSWNGSEIFDHIYTTWSKSHIQLQVLFYEEHKRAQNTVNPDEEPDDREKQMKVLFGPYERAHEFIKLFYKQFEDKVNDPNAIHVKNMQTPFQYCRDKVGNSSNLNRN